MHRKGASRRPEGHTHDEGQQKGGECAEAGAVEGVREPHEGPRVGGPFPGVERHRLRSQRRPSKKSKGMAFASQRIGAKPALLLGKGKKWGIWASRVMKSKWVAILQTPQAVHEGPH